MDKEMLRSKFFGAMVGTAVGDGLGAGFEGGFGVDCDDIEIAAEQKQELVYTDDTHMMLGVAESLARCGGFDGADMAMTFVRNYQQEPFRGYGPGPPRIFRTILNGTPWDEAASKLYGGGSFGNGAAMRIAPVGISYHSDMVKLKHVAYDSSRITHAHELGQEGAALQAYAVALAVNLDSGEPFHHGEFLAKLGDFVQSPVYKEKLGFITDLITRRDRESAIFELGNGIEAFNSVPAAIYSFLSYPQSFELAVLHAISLGGDTDTIGAMTGAISGAYLGIEAIPSLWHAKVENRLYIEALAEQLWQCFGDVSA